MDSSADVVNFFANDRWKKTPESVIDGGLVRWLVKKALVPFFPESEALPGIERLDLDAFVDRYHRESSGLIWLGVVLGAVVFTVTPLLTVYRPVPSFWLSADTLDRHADRLSSHPIYVVRQVVFLLKMVGGLCWGQHAITRERLALEPYAADPPKWRST